MADTQAVTPTTKKSKWLQEVENDAVRIQTKRFKDQEEERQYQISKRQEEQELAENKKGNN
jgi:hypothetical protein